VQETVPVGIEIVGCWFLCCEACDVVDVNIGAIRCSWQGARLRN